MLRIFFIIIFFCTSISAFCHLGKAKYHVIIDTDCAIDDLRSICYMLSSPDFEILAITTSDGILHPVEGYKKVKALLNYLNHEGIPVAYGETVNTGDLECHDLCIGINWGEEANISVPEKPGAKELIEKELNNEDETIFIMCLGPLTNISGLLKDSAFRNNDQIVWY